MIFRSNETTAERAAHISHCFALYPGT